LEEFFTAEFVDLENEMEQNGSGSEVVIEPSKIKTVD
jgi:hypothetical protein